MRRRPCGLLFTQYLRNVLLYEGLLFVSDPNERKRQLAKQLGADEAIDPAAPIWLSWCTSTQAARVSSI
jgi:threonine dehydrogenase-like Zn-dependent dehydrogenase